MGHLLAIHIYVLIPNRTPYLFFSSDLGRLLQSTSTQQDAAIDGKETQIGTNHNLRHSGPGCLLDEADRESGVTLPSYTEMCGDEDDLWSYEESEATLSYYTGISGEEECHRNSSEKSESTSPSYTEMNGDEQSRCCESENSGVILLSYTEMCGDEQSVCCESEKSGVTLPSYTEMCGDEESLIENGEVHASDNAESNEDEEIDAHRKGRLTLPGCSGDYVKENFLNLKDMKNYRYIGKKRVNLNEFENPATRWIDKEPHVPRTPPAESTAFGVKKLVNR